jgi:hypothetical protein
VGWLLVGCDSSAALAAIRHSPVVVYFRLLQVSFPEDFPALAEDGLEASKNNIATNHGLLPQAFSIDVIIEAIGQSHYLARLFKSFSFL